jgi:hypothetical protein
MAGLNYLCDYKQIRKDQERRNFPMQRPILVEIMIILFCLMFSAHAAWGLAVTYTETQIGVNFEYEFTMNNDTGTEIFELFLDVPLPDSSLLSFSSPAGWGDGSGGGEPFHGAVLPDTSFVEWFAELGSELGNGMSLSGFDFVSSSRVSPFISFSVNADPTSSGPAIQEGSVPVPEPTTVLLAGTGLIAIIGVRRKFI